MLLPGLKRRHRIMIGSLHKSKQSSFIPHHPPSFTPNKRQYYTGPCHLPSDFLHGNQRREGRLAPPLIVLHANRTNCPSPLLSSHAPVASLLYRVHTSQPSVSPCGLPSRLSTRSNPEFLLLYQYTPSDHKNPRTPISLRDNPLHHAEIRSAVRRHDLRSRPPFGLSENGRSETLLRLHKLCARGFPCKLHFLHSVSTCARLLPSITPGRLSTLPFTPWFALLRI